MIIGWFVRGLVATVAILWCSATAALAAVDMNGAWFIKASDPVSGLFFVCHLSVTQTGTSLTTEAPGCPYVGNLQGVGTIDVDTGAFAISSAPWGGFCSNAFSVTGTVNATSTAFTATYNCQTATMTFTGPVEGNRCGNGVLDAGEECDDGNRYQQDCCSPDCTLDASGVPCTDGNPCTSGTCDGAGMCDYAPLQGAPCADDGNGCTDDVCDASGVCQHAPNTAPCDDGDACTLNDVCAGGSCTSGTCSLCCDPLAGCVPAPASNCKQSVSPRGLLEYHQLADYPNMLKWYWRNGEATTPAELGDPTTSTSYAACIYRRFDTTEDLGLVLAAEAPAGAASGKGPGWKVRRDGSIKFKDRSGNAHGLTYVAVRPGDTGRPKFKVLGKGPALDLQSTYWQPTRPIAQLRVSNGTCFDAMPSPSIRDRVIVFGDVYEPPYSVDFLAKDAP